MAIANVFILKAQHDSLDIGLLQVIKWVFFAHGWGLVLLDRSLLDEAPEAWTYEPMYPTLYYTLVDQGRACRVNHPKSTYDRMRGERLIPVVENDAEATLLIDWVWKFYKEYSAVELCALANGERADWSAYQATQQQYPQLRNANINDSLIRREFEQVKARLEAQARKPVTPVNPFTLLLKQLAAVKEGIA